MGRLPEGQEKEFILLYAKIKIHKFYFCPTALHERKFLFLFCECKKMKKKTERLVSLSSLIQAFAPTRRIYKEVSKATAPLRITGIRPTLKGFTFRKARISKLAQIPTLNFIKEAADKLMGKKGKEKK